MCQEISLICSSSDIHFDSDVAEIILINNVLLAFTGAWQDLGPVPAAAARVNSA